jgi:hypothetical protein
MLHVHDKLQQHLGLQAVGDDMIIKGVVSPDESFGAILVIGTPIPGKYISS